MRWLIVIGVVAGCGEAKVTAHGQCVRACSHLLELSVSDHGKIDGAELKEIMSHVETQTPGTSACVARCDEGKLSVSCVMAARSVEQALSCGR